MYLSPNEVRDILDIIERQTAMLVSSTLGEGYLSSKDKSLLTKTGVDYKGLYKLSGDPIFTNFQLGMLAKVLGETNVKKLTYPALKKMIDVGKYISLNARENASLQSIKMQALSDIRSKGNKIFNDFNGAVNQANLVDRQSQEEFIRKEIYDGLEKRKAIRKITQDLAKKTGDFGRDFSKMVEYVSHKALTEGRTAIMRRKGGGDTKVYLKVYQGACKHCVNLYLTNGSESAPVVFKLDDLEANGSNIGRKVSEWLPTLPPIHPHCRCLVMEYQDGMEFDGKFYRFSKDYQSKLERPKVKIMVGDKEYMV